MAAPPNQGKAGRAKPTPTPRSEREAARSRFATAIARAELGRHYWSESSERALRAAMATKPKPKK
jgi:hypothetical protein